MTPAGEMLAAEIERAGPMSFRRFMEVALYHPQCGYYRRPRDPFGEQGDFFTAEQMQPVFGMLMAAHVRQLYRAVGVAADFTVVELGAGRGEMASALAPWRYIPIEIDSGELPERFGAVSCSPTSSSTPCRWKSLSSAAARSTTSALDFPTDVSFGRPASRWRCNRRLSGALLPAA